MKNRNIKKNKDSGFVLLFVVVLSSIILSIALGIADIAYKEFTFSTSAKNTNEAFFAADTGIECALYHDQSGATSAFGQAVPTPALTCAGTPINISTPETPPLSSWSFEILGLGASNKACAIVTVNKDSVAGTTEIISKGYNVGGENPTCTSTDINRLERELIVSYSDVALTADTFSLNMNGSGTVVSNENPTPFINCTTSCSYDYNVNDTVVLTATPTNGTDTITWTGCDSFVGNQCTVTINTNTVVSVTITSATTYIVTPSAGPNGTINPSTPQTVSSGGTTSFTITPNPTYSISSVSGCGGSLAGSTYTTGPITSDCTVSATFTSSAVMAGDLSPDQSSCTIIAGGSSCTVNFDWSVTNPQDPGGSQVTSNTNNSGASSPGFVVASGDSGTNVPFVIPYAGRTFFLYNDTVLLDTVDTTVVGPDQIVVSCAAGSTWNGSSCASSGFTLNVYKSGTGSGTAFTVLPSTGINCGIDCSEVYANNTAVVVRATAISGSTFSGWTGCDSISGPGGNTCNVTMTSDKNVTANFTLNTYTVTATAGTGGNVSPGSVTGILSGGTAQFTVTPNGGYSYGAITGTCPAGYSIGSDYFIENVTANCTVNFSFNLIADFPQERGTSIGSRSTESLSHTIPMSFTYQANDLLIAFVALDIDGTGSASLPSGWTQLLYNSQSNGTSSNVLEVLYKVATGSESDLVINTTTNSVISYKVTSVYNYNTTSPFVAGVIAPGNSINPNSPNVNASWGIAKNLWFSAVALDNGGLPGNNTIVTEYPSGYFNGQRQSTNGVSLDPNGVALVLAKRILEVSSQDPSLHTLSAIDRWVAATIGVRGQ